MHWFDVSFTVALILSGVWSCFRGFIRELLSLIGLAAASVLAIRGYPLLAPMLAPLITALWIRQAIGFALIFLAVMAGAMVCSMLIRLLIRAVGLSLIDRLLGGIFGVAKVVLVVSVLLIMARKFYPDMLTHLATGSVLAPLLAQSAAWLETWIGQHEEVMQRLQQQLQ